MTQYIHIIVEYDGAYDDYYEKVIEAYSDLALAEERLLFLEKADANSQRAYHGYKVHTVLICDDLTDEEIIAVRKRLGWWEYTRGRMVNPAYAAGVHDAIAGDVNLPRRKSDRVNYESGKTDWALGRIILEL